MRFSTAISLSLITILSLASCKQEMRPPIDGDENANITAAQSKVVIGADNRQSISHIDSSLSRQALKVGQLITYYQVGNNQSRMQVCTASLIANNYIITAAHCAFNESGDSLLTHQYFYPGIDEENTSPYGKYPVLELFLPSSFSKQGDSANPNHDMAIMRIGNDEKGVSAGSKVGTFGFWGREEFVDSKALTIGYPGDKPSNTQYFENNCQVYGNNYNDLLELECDVYRGQSGSPLLIHSDKYDGYYLQGVISAESSDMNYGSRLSDERSKIIKYILKGEFNSQAYQNENFQEQWKSLDYGNPSIIDVRVKNTCSSELYLAYRYKSKDGEWRSEGYTKLKANEERFLFQTGNGIWYLRGVNENRNIVTNEDSYIYLDREGRKVSFQKYSVDKYGSFTYEFGCY